MQSLHRALSRLAAQRAAHRFQMAWQHRGAALVARGEIRQALTEGLTRTGRIHAAKPPLMQAETDWRLTQRQIS